MQKLKWSLGRHAAWYGQRDGCVVCVVFARPDGWEWWSFLTAGSNGKGFATADAAKRAAEEGIDG